jgi:methionine aminopeptidase
MEISDDELDKYRIAGEIAKEVRKEVKQIVTERKRIFDICTDIESLIRKKRCQSSFSL